jgi:trimethylamine-N-oxide reductase (cytochrome c) cytochrome c-type subunit TorY
MIQRGGKTLGLTTVAIVVAIVIGSVILFLVLHELAVANFQTITCGTCHVMKEPVRKWQESGAAKNHGNCASCHFQSGIKGRVEMTNAAFKEFVKNFQRGPNEPINPPEEPVLLEYGKEPAYWSLVPNHRCYQCHDAKNHRPEDQEKVHGKFIKRILEQRCKDCHSHEMQNGQKFYFQASEIKNRPLGQKK